MCRYAMFPYKSHYACFECRKTFKRRLLKDINRELGHEDSVEAKCPQCGGLMADMGLDFESPKMNDTKTWEHIAYKRFIFSGNNFSLLRLFGTGVYSS